MKNFQKKIRYRFLLYGVGVILLILLGCGLYWGVYEYIYYRDYKTVKNIKLIHIYPVKHDNFKIELPVKFVSKMHDAEILCQKILVIAENKKTYMIVRYNDDKIQLLSLPVARYFYTRKYFWAYYEIQDAAAEAKLIKLLDDCCEKKNEETEE